MKNGTYVIVRCRDAGVHAGVLIASDGRSCELKEARRLWRFRVPMGSSEFLSGVAVDGLDHTDCKIGAPISVMLTETCEIISCSPKAESSIREAPTWKRTK